MILIRKKKKILLKKFIALRKNVQYRPKILKFKKKKWQKLIFSLQKEKTRRYSVNDHSIHFLPTYYVIYFKHTFRENLQTKQRFNYFYGNLRVKYVKTIVKKLSKQNNIIRNFNAFLDTIESRLDVVLYRCNFVETIKKARQLIRNKGVLVNNNLVTNSSFLLKVGDIIEINHFYLRNIYLHVLLSEPMWPLTPNHLQINHSTLQIVLVKKPSQINTPIFFPFWFSIDTIMDYFK